MLFKREGKYEIEPNKHFRVAPKGTDRYAYVGRSEVPREIKPGDEVAGKEPIVWIIKKSP